MDGVNYPRGSSWLPIRMILTKNYNSAHWNHLHVEPTPKQYGTPPLSNPGVSANGKLILAAMEDFFPDIKIGIYNRRYIGGTTKWSQHSWSNAFDLYATSQQEEIYAMLTAPTRPEGGDLDVKEVYARLQASLVRAGHDLGNWAPYLPAGDPDSLVGADGSWGNDSRNAQDAANATAAIGTVDSVARSKANKAHTRLDKLHQI